ncbi:hypothetical protein [Nocardioides kongjuensis]|uniref:hypothetical protein n=1 Tax=Nocardioides kongjuensis TaxID=349522 RepID=UPI0031F18F68
MHGIGINFAFYAFLGALVGSVARPLGGYLADRFGGGRITLVAFGGMVLGTLGILVTLGMLEPLPPAPDKATLAKIAADPAAFQFPDARAHRGRVERRRLPAVPRPSSCSSSRAPGSATARRTR